MKMNKDKEVSNALNTPKEMPDEDSIVQIDPSFEMFGDEKYLILEIKPIQDKPLNHLDIRLTLEKLKELVEMLEKWKPVLTEKAEILEPGALPPGLDLKKVQDDTDDVGNMLKKRAGK